MKYAGISGYRGIYGTYKTNLFNFQHYNLTQGDVYIDGEQIPWINPCS